MNRYLYQELFILLILRAICESNGASFASTMFPSSASKSSISPSRNTAFVNQARHSASSVLFKKDRCNRFPTTKKMNLQAGMLLDLSGSFDALASSDLILAAQSGVLGAATSFHKMMQASQFLFDSASTYVSIYMLNAVVADHTNRKMLPKIEDLVPTKLSFLDDAHQLSETELLNFDDDMFQNSLYVNEPHQIKPSADSLNRRRQINHSFPDLPDPEEDDENEYLERDVENRNVIEIEEDIVVHEDPTDSTHSVDDEDYYLPSYSNNQDLNGIDCNNPNVQEFKSEEEFELEKLKERTHRALLQERLALEKRQKQDDFAERVTHEVDTFDNSPSLEASIRDEEFEVEESEPTLIEDFFICEDSNFFPEECEMLEQKLPLIVETKEGSISIADSKHGSTKEGGDLFFADEVYPDLPMAQGLCDAAFQAERNRRNTRKNEEYTEKLERDMADLREHIVKKGIESEISRRRQLAHAEASNLLKKYVEEENAHRYVTKSKETEEVFLEENVVAINDTSEGGEHEIDTSEYEPQDSYSKLFSPRSKRNHSKKLNGRFKRVKGAGSAALDILLPNPSFSPVKRVGKVSSNALESIFPVKTEEVLALAKKREIVLTSVAIVFARRLLRIWVGPLFPF